MEQFVYSDIFDTKGIEYVIVIFFFLLMIPFWRMLNRPLRLKETLGDTFRAINLQAIRVPQGLLFNRNHTWSHMESSGVASVGMDDMLLHLTGGIELDYLKKQKEKVKRGEPIARIFLEEKELMITSPISGRIESIHSSLEANTGAIREDPYSSWLYRIRPENWRKETGEALLGEEASKWTGKELERFRDYLAENLSEAHATGLVLQEGGELTGHPLRELDNNAWKVFQEKFLEMKS